VFWVVWRLSPRGRGNQAGLHGQTRWANGGEFGSDGNAANADFTRCGSGQAGVHDTRDQEKQERGPHPTMGL